MLFYQVLPVLQRLRARHRRGCRNSLEATHRHFPVVGTDGRGACNCDAAGTQGAYIARARVLARMLYQARATDFFEVMLYVMNLKKQDFELVISSVAEKSIR